LSKYEVELLTLSHDSTKLMINAEADKGLKWVAMAGTDCGHGSSQSLQQSFFRQEKKRKDYTFWRQFNEKPSIMPGCPGRTSFSLLPNSVSMCPFSLL